MSTCGDNFILVKSCAAGVIDIATDDCHFELLTINYCPMCGRTLKREKRKTINEREDTI